MLARLAAAADFCQRLSLNTSHIMFRGRRFASPAKRGAVQQQMAPDRGLDQGKGMGGQSAGPRWALQTSVCFKDEC